MPKPTLPIFHGTKRRFEQFDARYYATGEASVGIGFYFAANPRGAAAHATRMLRNQAGDPLTYVCRLKSSALMLTPWRRISDHPQAVKDRWHDMPALYAWAEENSYNNGQSSWIDNLRAIVSAESARGLWPSTRVETALFALLKRQGFDAIYDAEGMHTDPYVGGPTVLVLNEDAIAIEEVLPAAVVLEEIERDMGWTVEPEPRALPKTGHQSRLQPTLRPQTLGPLWE